MHGAERRDDLRDLGWEIRRGSIERLPEGSAGEQAEQHLDALVVDECLDQFGPVEVGSETKQELTAQAKAWGQVSWDNEANAVIADQRTAEMLQLIAATREYQFA